MMERKPIILQTLLCALILSLLFIIHLTSTKESLKEFDHHNVKDVLVRNWYTKHHEFIPANHSCIEYQGRWMRSPNLARHEASFAGSSIRFAIRNTTSLRLSLANHPMASPHYGKEESKAECQLVLTPSKLHSTRADPVDIIVSSMASKEAHLHQGVFGLITIAQSLRQNETFVFELSLAESQKSSTIQFEGLWLSKGGALAKLPEDSTRRKSFKSNSTLGSTIVADQECGKRRRQLLEIVAPTTMLQNTLQDSRSLTNHRLETWPDLLRQHFDNITTSLVSFSSSTCLARRCQVAQAKDHSAQQPLISETFFRAGQPETDLYRRLWPFASSLNSNASPTALILIIGVTDIIEFLDSSSGNLHEVNAFLDEYARTYSTFIQTIRRTAYSSSSLASYETLHTSSSETFIDESYLYNSAPSTLPIFLVLQPLPSSLMHPLFEYARLLLHHATSRVIDDLKWHIGDKKTFVVDTAGWLVDEDFAQGLRSESVSNVAQLSLTQSGHIKFAHHMSLHLCHCIIDHATGWSKCPFDRHDEYVGNLYLPDADNIKKLLEEKKIAAVKEMFGVL